MIKLKKIKVGIIFGGRSGEHEVSLVSATSVINALNKNKYEITQIGITKTGQWVSGENCLELLKNKQDSKIPKFIFTPDIKTKKLDVIFPVLHGPFGEDGTIQGLLELANIPYVGCGVLGSAVGMDKIIQKQLYAQNELPIGKWTWLSKKELKKSENEWLDKIIQKIKFSMFVKPANMGSSIGINKSHNKKEFIEHIIEAGKYDRKILIEESIEDAREIEISILGNDDPQASVPGEIIPSGEFYDYNAKYVDAQSKVIIPAKLPQKTIKELQKIAIKAFKVLDCQGMARVDFLVKRKTNKIYINEINTIPGFTSISMYPKLWEASGLSYSKLMDNLIKLAFERHQEENKLATSYQPKKDWHKLS